MVFYAQSTSAVISGRQKKKKKKKKKKTFVSAQRQRRRRRRNPLCQLKGKRVPNFCVCGKPPLEMYYKG